MKAWLCDQKRNARWRLHSFLIHHFVSLRCLFVLPRTLVSGFSISFSAFPRSSLFQHRPRFPELPREEASAFSPFCSRSHSSNVYPKQQSDGGESAKRMKAAAPQLVDANPENEAPVAPFDSEEPQNGLGVQICCTLCVSSHFFCLSPSGSAVSEHQIKVRF